VLLPLEESILQIALVRLAGDTPDFHGFALAEELESGEAIDHLLGFGTLYKALARLERDGLLSSEWEVVDPVTAGRPRRRLYRATASAAVALARSQQLREVSVVIPTRLSPA
jgi:DNA-binding PadR family transcriptional regulator